MKREESNCSSPLSRSYQVSRTKLLIRNTDFIHMNDGNIKKFYRIMACIGRGAYGEVRKCLSKDSNSIRAVKIITKKNLQEK